MKKIFNKEFFILVALTLIFFLVQMVVPYIGIDDFYAHHVGYNDNLFLRGINRAIIWNTRIGEIILFSIGWLPKFVYNIVISFFFAYFLILMKKYSNTNYKNKLSQYILYYFLIICASVPLFINIFFKMSDASNHLIGTCLILTVLLAIIKFDNGSDIIQNSKFKYNMLLIVSFFAGMASENNSIFILIFHLYVIVKNFIKSKIIVRWQIFSFIATLAGYILLIFSGSTFHRIEFFYDDYGTFTTPIINIIRGFWWYYNKIIIIFIILLVIYIIIGIVKDKRNFKFDNKIKYNIKLLVMSLSTLLMFMFSPYYQNRGTLLILFFLLINIVDLINIILSKLNYIFLMIISIVLLIISLIFTFDISIYFYNYRIFDEQRNIQVQDQIKNNSETVTFPIYKVDSKYHHEFSYQEYTICDKEVLKNRYNIYYDYQYKLICE